MNPEGGLYNCLDPARWKLALDAYEDALKAKGSKQRKLLSLDKWYQKDLPLAIAERKGKYLAKEELVKLMEWKLSRGTFRPRLQQLVATNSSEAVEETTRNAFALLPDVASAVKELSKLKAVGPATASAILAAGAPETAAFMADEAIESIPGMSPIRYTLKHYLLYLERIQSCAERLNAVDFMPVHGASSSLWIPVDSRKTWTPHCVEMSLWASAVAHKLNLPALQVLDGEKEEGGCVEELSRARKKQRTE